MVSQFRPVAWGVMSSLETSASKHKCGYIIKSSRSSLLRPKGIVNTSEQIK